jgi:uncharacterized protein (TIGR03435 family)
VTRKPRTPALCLTAFALLSAHLLAQVPSTVPTFEVSTVKPSSPDANNSQINMSPFKALNVPLDAVIKFAYSLNDGSDDQLIGAPSWLHTTKFDIITKTDDATNTQLSKLSIPDRLATSRLMVQTLLADRFHLKIHHETRPLPVIALTLANPNATTDATTDAKLTQVPDPLTSPNPSHQWSGLSNDGNGHVKVQGMPIKVFAEFLGNLPEIDGRLVVDQTGLTGTYAFNFNWTPQRLGESPDNGSSDPSGPSLFAALTEQLGLKLKSTKAPIDVIVIDHIDPPTPN